MSQKMMKCAHCGDALILEERENPEFLDAGRSVFGGPVCFVCFEKSAPEILAGVCE